MQKGYWNHLKYPWKKPQKSRQKTKSQDQRQQKKPTRFRSLSQNCSQSRPRSQYQNRDVAMKMLISKLVEIKEREHLEKISDIKGVQQKIEWGSQIRSYVFHPYSLVKDHRTGYETSNVDAVMDGELDGFINAYLTAEATGNWATK